MPPNVRYVGHVYTRDHNAFNCTPRAVLNVNRESMARYGFSPPTRVFEAAGAGACLITDAWEGIELFLEPGREVLVARERRGGRRASRSADARARARSIGEAARSARARRAHLRAPRARRSSAAARRAAAARWRPERAWRDRLSLVILGLSITSSWGNGHATTYRGAGARARRARARRAVPRARPALVRRATATCRSRRTGAPCCTAASTSCATASRATSARPTLVIVGSYVPDGRRGRRLGARRRRAASTAFYDIDTPVTLAKLRARRRASTSRRDLIAALRPLPLVHRRADARRGSSASYGSPARARRSTARSTPSCTARSAAERALGPRLSRAPTATTGSRRSSACSLEPARRWPRAAASSSPGRSIPATIALAGERRARSSTSRRRDHRAFYTAQRFTLNVTRADMVARRAGRRACGCSRPRRAACRSSATSGRGSTSSSSRAARSSSPVGRRHAGAAADAAGRGALAAAERARRRVPRRTRPPTARRSSRRSCSKFATGSASA